MAKTKSGRNSYEKNIYCDSEKLDADIKVSAGNLYNQSVISTFVLGRSASYYGRVVRKGKIAESCLSKLCRYYHLNKGDYIVVKPKLALVKTDESIVTEQSLQAEPETSSKVEVNIDIDAVLGKLTEITTQLADATKAIVKVTSVLGTCYAEEKSISYLISQLHDKMSQHCKNEKDILEKLEQNTRYRKNSGSRRIG